MATGLTYCGVVGHVARCEYTVIGRKVNMAARLMCNYPNIISCDQETYYNSRLNSRFFQILPDKILKVIPPKTQPSIKRNYSISGYA